MFFFFCFSFPFPCCYCNMLKSQFVMLLHTVTYVRPFVRILYDDIPIYVKLKATQIAHKFQGTKSLFF